MKELHWTTETTPPGVDFLVERESVVCVVRERENIGEKEGAGREKWLAPTLLHTSETTHEHRERSACV